MNKDVRNELTIENITLKAERAALIRHINHQQSTINILKEYAERHDFIKEIDGVLFV